MNEQSRIYVAGQNTLIGSAIHRQLKLRGFGGIVGDGWEPNPAVASEVGEFFSDTRPEYVFAAAGPSGGIGANERFPADLMYENLLSACHVIESAFRYGSRKLLYLASSCTYPKHCAQPMSVSSLLSGPLESTSQYYALSKLAGIYLCDAFRRQHGASFISGIPAEVFGSGDDFDPQRSHVVAALITKMHDAKESSAPEVEIWGSGKPRREFVFADDLADACIFSMLNYDDSPPINLGSGVALSIRELAELIREVLGYAGALRFNASRPDGTPVKLLDSTRLRELGWSPKTTLRQSLSITYQWFLENRTVSSQ